MTSLRVARTTADAGRAGDRVNARLGHWGAPAWVPPQPPTPARGFPGSPGLHGVGRVVRARGPEEAALPEGAAAWARASASRHPKIAPGCGGRARRDRDAAAAQLRSARLGAQMGDAQADGDSVDLATDRDTETRRVSMQNRGAAAPPSLQLA